MSTEKARKKCAEAGCISSIRSSCIYAIVISWHPDLQHLQAQFAALLAQVDQIVWVDNGSDSVLQRPGVLADERVQLLALTQNEGLAFAQNRGIECAIKRGATHILLMDQDSLPQSGMVATLLTALNKDTSAAAAGPFYRDPRRAKASKVFFRTVRGRRLWRHCDDTSDAIKVDFVIASGCLIPASVLQHIGLMREDFFIDWIDIEWCLRARRLGYEIYGVCSAQLGHRLGEHLARLGQREIPIHAPWRHYYQARNFVLTLKSAHMGMLANASYAWAQCKKSLYFAFFTGRRGYLRMMLRGFWHGLRGITGSRVRP